MRGYYFVASPYSHAEAAVREARFREACHFVAWAVRQDMVVFSPIVHSHPLAVLHGLPGDAAFWAKANRNMLTGAWGLIVLDIGGWETSAGVRDEIAAARDQGKVRWLYGRAGEGWALSSEAIR